MNATDEFLAHYIDPETGELPPPQELSPENIHAMHQYFLEIEEGERLAAQEFGHLRFVG